MSILVTNRNAGGGLGSYVPAAQRIPFGSSTPGQLTDSADLKWDDTNKVFTLGRAGTARFTITIGGAGAVTLASSDDQAFKITAKATASLVLQTNSTDALTISFDKIATFASGSLVGIGATPAAGQHLLVSAASAMAVVNASSGSGRFAVHLAGTEEFTVHADATSAVLYSSLRDLYIQTQIAKDIILRPQQVEKMRLLVNGDVVIGNGNTAATVIATTATAGFLRLSTCAGVPTGASVDGSLVLDTTGGKVYVRTGGAWAALN